jgi:hypothetical protein
MAPSAHAADPLFDHVHVVVNEQTGRGPHDALRQDVRALAPESQDQQGNQRPGKRDMAQRPRLEQQGNVHLKERTTGNRHQSRLFSGA